MKLLSWNCRGLGTLQAVRALAGLIHSEDPDLVFLMETRKKVFEMRKIRCLQHFEHLFGVDCTGSGHSKGGGLCLLWRREIDVTVLSSSVHHIDFNLAPACLDVPVHISAIYGFPESQHKCKTWQLIQQLKSQNEVPWLCCGDFNDVLSPDDKKGGDPVSLSYLQYIYDAMAECSIADLGAGGEKFTWCNNRKIP